MSKHWAIFGALMPLAIVFLVTFVVESHYHYRRHFAWHNDDDVKAAPRVSARDLAGLKAIGELPRVVRRILIYRGSRRLAFDDGIEAWPFEAWCRAVADDALWP